MADTRAGAQADKDARAAAAAGASAGDEILRVRNLRTTFHAHRREIRAVRGIDLDVRRGEILAVVGESGSGKSVSMKSVMGLMPPNAEVTAGELTFDGRDLLAMGPDERRAMRGPDIAMVFQDPMTSLDPVKTVGSHLFEVLRRHRGLEGDEARREAVRILDMVGIPSPESRLSQYPFEFSGGMRQRVLIAMALCCRPRLLIADEPTTALDVTIQAQILELLNSLRGELGMSIVLITHDLGIVASTCDRAVVMYGGLVMEQGTVDDVFYRALHPYTRALLRAVPNPENLHDRLRSIPGSAMSLVDPPATCPFAERCGFACYRCHAGVPGLRAEGEWRASRCVFTGAELDQMREDS